jgi:opacity protein-like surface antigen
VRPAPLICLGLALAFALPASAASAPVAVNLAGSWSGTWSDPRPGYNGSGGSFTGTLAQHGEATWAGQFSLGKSKTFDVELKGQQAGGKVEFDTTVNLGKAYGIYVIKGSATSDELTGSYSGPGESGTFRMKRVPG